MARPRIGVLVALAIVASVAMVPLTARAATAPDAPTNVQATAGNASADVSWTAPVSDGGSPITSYTVTPSPADVTVPDVAIGTSTTVTGLTNGTAYTFTVVAHNSIGPGPPSAASTPVTPTAPAATAPGAPTTVLATPSDGSAGVSWTAPVSDGGSAITSYTVTPSPAGVTVPPVTSGTSTTVTGLTNGTSYTFTVVATNAVGDGPPSAPSSAVTPATVPAAPTAVVATAGNGSAGVAWTPPASDGGSAITGYTVTSSPDGKTATAAGNATGATVTGLTNGTAYTFTVTATNANGVGAPSAASTPVTPSATVPDPPTNLLATAGNGSASVSWTAPAFDGGSPITSYTVTPSPAGVTVPPVTTGTTVTVTGLTNGTSYTFTVAANNSVGASAASAPSSAVVPSATVPAAPTNVAATAGNGSADVSWTAPASDGGSPITGYTATSTPAVTIAPVTSGTSTTVTGLTNGTSYTFTVTATNIAGTGPASTPSNPIVPAATMPGAPSNVGATGGNGSATVTWTAPASDGGSAITGYTVTSSPGGQTATATGTTATVTGLTNGTHYTFTVTATNAVGTGPASGPSSQVTPSPLVPDAPTNVAATPGNGSATVTWTAPANNGGSPITSYTVTPSPADVTVPPVTGTIVTVTGLTNGTSYTFTVAANNAVGAGVTSTSAAVIPAGRPFAPTNVTAVSGQAAADLYWDAANANGSPILSYDINEVAGPFTARVAGDVLSLTISGLVNGNTYHFVVFANNALGTSPQSLFSSPAVTPAVPTVTSLSPNKGPYSGGTTVKITGTNLAGVKEVHFGSVVIPVAGIIVLRPGAIQVTSPFISDTFVGTVHVTVTITGGTTAAVFGDQFTYTNTCLKASVLSDPASPQAIGTIVKFTASATGCPKPNFVFWLRYPNGTWVPKQGFGPSAIWSWTTAGLPAGVYTIHVGAVEAGYSQTTFQALAQAFFTLGGCTSATLSLASNHPSPQIVGAPVSFTASESASSCSRPTFEYWLQYPNGTWVMKRPFSAVATWLWDSRSYPLGNYTVLVWANQAGDPQVHAESWQPMAFTLISTACTGVSVAASPASPAMVGTPVTITGTASGCLHPDPLYEFWILAPGAKSWQPSVPAYGPASYVWSTVGKAVGTYRISVWVKDSSSPSTVAYDAFNASSYFTLTRGCSAVRVSAVPASPVMVGTLVRLTGQASGCLHPSPLYKFWILAPGSTTWQSPQDYSASATFDWTVTTGISGTYRISVWARDSANSTVAYDAFNASSYFTLTRGCSAVRVSAVPASPVMVRTLVRLTGQASGCLNASPLYEFWILAPGSSTWQKARPYDSSAGFDWTGNGSGTYRVSVWVKDSLTDPAAYDAFNASSYFTLTPGCSSVAVSVSPTSPATVGTTITITGTAFGCLNPSPVYGFWILAPGAKSWQRLLPEYGPASYQWSTAGKAKGTYRISVWVRDSSSSAAYDAFNASQYFVLS